MVTLSHSLIKTRVRSVRPRDEETSKPLVVIPYVSGLSEDIRRICRRFGVRVVFKSGMSLRSQLSRLKDVLPLELHSGIVQCSICEKSYIGETIRRLGSRVNEHKDACVRCEIDKSALAEHAWNEEHPVAWDKATILDKDSMRMRLVIKEALHISSNKGTLMNRDTGLELPGCWLSTQVIIILHACSTVNCSITHAHNLFCIISPFQIPDEGGGNAAEVLYN